MDVQIPIYIENNIFVELGLANLAPDHKESMLDKMNELVHKRVMIRILDELPEDAKMHLESVPANTDEQEMRGLLEQVPNLADILLDEIAAVRGLMHASAASIEVQAV